MKVDRNSLEILDRDVSLDLLSTVPFGRVAITAAAMPVILPVSFRLLDSRIVFATGAGTKLAAATAGKVLAFEADHIDASSGVAWSVCVTAIGEVVTDPATLERARGLPLQPLVAIDEPAYVQLATDVISGRRGVLAALAPPIPSGDA
ncbi:MAG TPA: pyridoxamine 5'-phosphate oxidase family protein [Acidimicrobiales bacterium]|nr:pyridoxamine 5'-phosphate oxidase family protein [Acidimicrobiales bacterium]